MKIVLQKVKNADVTVDHQVIGSINKGLLAFIGMGENDTKDIVDKLIQKIIKLRIFEDEEGKTNLSLSDVKGDILLISQFTLYADCKKGNRPSFTKVLAPNEANDLYLYFVDQFRKEYSGVVEMGEFGADMKVSLLNDGPFTVILDSKEMNI